MKDEKMDEAVRDQVETYARANYKMFAGKNLIITEHDKHFEVLHHKDGSPLILGKGILSK